MPAGNLIEVSFGKSHSADNTTGHTNQDGSGAPVCDVTARIKCRNGEFLDCMKIRMVTAARGAVVVRVTLSHQDRKWVKDNLAHVTAFLKRIVSIKLPRNGREWNVLPNSQVKVVFPEDLPDCIRLYFFVAGTVANEEEVFSSPRTAFRVKKE